MTKLLPPFAAGLRQQISDYVFITAALCCYAFAITCFLLPYDVTSGGVSGISSIIYFVTRAAGQPLEVQYTYLAINVLLLAVAVKELGWRFCIRTIYAVCCLSLLLFLFQRIVEDEQGNLPHWVEDQAFLACLIGGAFEGIGLAICFLHNGSTGGTDIIASIVNKYKNVTLGNVIMVCDIVIISSSWFIFHNPKLIVFGFVTLITSSVTLDYVMNKQRQSVQFLIFSRNYTHIADTLIKLGHGCTVLDGTGWYTRTERKVVVCLTRKRESMSVFRMLKVIDPYAFVSMANVQGVYGEGFDPIKANTKVHKRTLVFATNNRHKLEEVRAILGEGYDVRGLEDIGCKGSIPETGSTFRENALQKAQFVKQFFGFDCFADDSGLEVEALHGAPGVFSARYAAIAGKDNPAEVVDDSTDEENMDRLLADMKGATNRRADFRTVIAFVTDTDVHYFEGRVDGTILPVRQGDGGFGYDPLFMPDGHAQTFAQMGSEEKNAMSHRAQAVQQLAEFLKGQAGA